MWSRLGIRRSHEKNFSFNMWTFFGVLIQITFRWKRFTFFIFSSVTMPTKNEAMCNILRLQKSRGLLPHSNVYTDSVHDRSYVWHTNQYIAYKFQSFSQKCASEREQWQKKNERTMTRNVCAPCYFALFFSIALSFYSLFFI